MYESYSVAVVVPAYNEAGLVGEVIETIPTYVDRIYAVDDRSTDGTWDEIVRHAARRNGSDPDPVDGRPTSRSPRDTAADGGVESGEVVVPIRHEENRGVGGAITTGYQYALADGIDVTAVMAGDGQMNPCLLYTSPSPRDRQKSRMPSSA